MSPKRTIAAAAVIATAGIAIPLAGTVTANAAEFTPAPQSSPMAAAFGTVARGDAPALDGAVNPKSMGEGADAGCDIVAADMAEAGYSGAQMEAAASQGAQPAVAAPAYTSPAQAALAGAASGATSGALAGLVTGGPEGALVGAGVGGVGGAVGGAAAAAVNNAVSGATAGGKSSTPTTNNDTAFD